MNTHIKKCMLVLLLVGLSIGTSGCAWGGVLGIFKWLLVGSKKASAPAPPVYVQTPTTVIPPAQAQTTIRPPPAANALHGGNFRDSDITGLP